jgi:uncharacterized membrane protein (TIGR02234 family)
VADDRTARLLSRPVTFGCLLAGGLLAVVATAQPWWRAAGDGARVAFSGTEATGGLSQALAVVTLAGTLLVLVLKVRGRRLLAVLLGLVGLGQVLVGVLRLRPTADAVRTRIREVSLADQYALSASVWPWVYALAGLVVLAGALALLLGARSWSLSASARFDRTEARTPSLSADDPAGLWKALDAGLDPTDPVGRPAPAEAAQQPSRTDPDVHNDDTGDTMVPDRHVDPTTAAHGRSGSEPEHNSQTAQDRRVDRPVRRNEG